MRRWNHASALMRSDYLRQEFRGGGERRCSEHSHISVVL